ncbi:hypothetical protein [Dermatobacter hominis]|uniref:hypothetical protein n=1 Tax=Dermatobacter hominis TaxID=2884263 RepID=UPI001D115821|nr:hypothetical protein [Dermatobacter hominis]UDY34620.1 hypothetical protein LH044_14905 [Dermatobacter hominis]
MGDGHGSDGDAPVDGAPSRPRARRGTARERLREASARLLSGATLDDVTAFITVNRLTAASGLSSGAIYSAFASDGARSAPQAAARQLFLSIRPQDDPMVIEILEQLHGSMDDADDAEQRFVETLAELAAAPVVASARSSEPWDYTHLWLAAAVAINDEEVRDAVRHVYVENTRTYERAIARALELVGRTPVEGIDIHMLASMLVAGADGAAVRLRFDPDADPDLVRLTYLSTIASMTRRVDEADDLFASRVISSYRPQPQPVHLDDVRDAVRAVDEREGWAAVTVTRIVTLTGIAESAFVAMYPTRHHLATFIWDDVLGTVERRARARQSLDASVQVVELVADLAETACARRSLVASLLTARLHAAATSDGAVLDPSSERLVGLLGSLLEGDEALRTVAARTAVDGLLMAAAAADAEAEELARVLIAGLASISRSALGT